ncbi:MAG: outer membrane protein assembly factor BamC [Pseudomonadota bacterium]
MKKISLLLLPTLLTVAGCSSFSLDRKADYRSSKPGPSLELPPDVNSPVFENRYTIPASTLTAPSVASGTPTITSSASGNAANGSVVPQGSLATVVKEGQQRWLVVKLPPEQVWKIAREFWTQSGFTVQEERPDAGVMETDWAENRAKIPQDIIRNTIGKVLDMLYSTAERDKFKTRLELNAKTSQTEVYISHKGMIEVADSATDARVYKWQPRPADIELEAEMLQRLAVKINKPDMPVSQIRKDEAAQSAIPTEERKDRAKLVKDAKNVSLSVEDNFESTWQRTSLALERLDFTLEDRNRQQGLFILRYGSEKPQDKKKWSDRLSFWKADSKTQTATYRIKLNNLNAQRTQIVVENSDGQPADTRVSETILTLLQAQLR